MLSSGAHAWSCLSSSQRSEFQITHVWLGGIRAPFFSEITMIIDYWYFALFLAGVCSGWAFITGMKGF